MELARDNERPLDEGAPEARRDIAGEGGAGRFDASEDTEFLLAFGVIGVVGVVTDGSGAGGGVGVIGEKTRIGEAGWVSICLSWDFGLFFGFGMANSWTLGIGGGRNGEPGDGNGDDDG